VEECINTRLGFCEAKMQSWLNTRNAKEKKERKEKWHLLALAEEFVLAGELFQRGRNYEKYKFSKSW
jgi:hypothetical protein